MTYFDTTAYVTVPGFDVPAGIAMVTALLNAVPEKLKPRVQEHLDKLSAAAAAEAQRWSTLPSQGPLDTRRFDAALDRAWAAMSARLEAWTLLPPDVAPECKLATSMMKSLFPTGLDFLKLAYAQEWAESAKRVRQIDDNEWGPTLDRLAGPVFLRVLREAHGDYGDALGITTSRPQADAPVRSEILERLRAATARYVFGLLAITGQNEETDAQVRLALQPIDDQRAAFARRSRSDGDAAPVNPAPVAPAPVPAVNGAPAAPANGAAPVANPVNVAGVNVPGRVNVD